MAELLWTASHVHDFICIIYMHNANSIKITSFSLPNHQHATAYILPSITNWSWYQSRINYYNSRWTENMCRVLCHLYRLRQKQKWSYVIFKIVYCVLEVQQSSLSKVMTFTLIPFCPEVTQQTQLLWTHFLCMDLWHVKVYEEHVLSFLIELYLISCSFKNC